MVPPSSGIELAKNPSNIDEIIMTNKSQNQVVFNFFNGKSNTKKIPVKKNNFTNTNEAAPKPL